MNKQLIWLKDMFQLPNLDIDTDANIEYYIDQERRAKFLNLLTIGLTLISSCYLVLRVFVDIGDLPFVLNVVVTFMFAGLLLLNRKGYYKVASYTFCLLFNTVLYMGMGFQILDSGFKAISDEPGPAYLLGLVLFLVGALVNAQIMWLFTLANSIVFSLIIFFMSGENFNRNLETGSAIILFWLFVSLLGWLYENTLHQAFNRFVETNNRLTEHQNKLTQTLQALETAHKQSQHHLSEAITFRQLIEASGQGIGFADLEGQIIYLNPMLAELLEANNRAAMIGQTFINYYPKPLQKKFRQQIKPAIDKDGQWTGEMTLLTKKQQRIPTLENTFIIKDDVGNPSYLGTIIIDMTVQKQIQTDLRTAKEEAEAANRAKSVFLANMSHELRTPLNGILGYTQILQADKSLTDNHYNKLRVIYRSGTHLLNLINDILDFSKMEADRMELFYSQFGFQTFLEGIITMVAVQADKKNLPLEFEMGADLPIAVEHDEKRLSQILINLLSNAIKFTHSGQVLLQVHRQADKVRFQVTDTGIGIQPEKLTEIFEPFKQVGEQSLVIEGTGLGLAISHRLVDLLGGTLQVTSTVGKGSTFWFDLTLKEVETWEVAPQVEDHHIIGFQGGVYKVLIVDDVEYNQSFLVNVLLPLGFEILTADDGQDGIEKASLFEPDLILMDLVMPKMNGLEATNQIKETYPHTKVIIVSASSPKDLQGKNLEINSDDYLPKPVQVPLLLDKIKEHLGLEWVVETDSTSNQPLPTAETALIAPPQAELQQLYQLAENYDFAEVDSWVTRIKGQNKAYIPFANKVGIMAKEFEADEICGLIERFLD